jgi:small Trp-rich protein
MAFVIIGALLVLMKWLDYGPVANWSWWWILAPFAVAFAWWQFADASGLSRKREMDKLDRRKEDRRAKNMEALGLDYRRDKRVRVFKDNKKREAERQEAEREAKRKAAREAADAPAAGQAKPGAGLATDHDTRLE